MTDTTQNNKSKDINEIINLMNRVNETFGYGIWIPSLNKEVMFREITTAQQKRLVKAVIDSPVYNTEFIFAINQIIKENCIEKIDIDELTILDKLFICLKMRAVSISDTLELEFKHDEKELKRGISLNKVYEEAKEKFPVEKLKTFTIKDDKYEIICGMPTLKVEYSLERELRNNTQDIEIKDIQTMRNVVGDVYITELVKFIKQINVTVDDEQVMKIDFNDNINCRNRIAIIENIPTKVIDKVIKYINDIKTELSKLTLISFTVKDKDGNDKEIKEGITIDGNFFINS